MLTTARWIVSFWIILSSSINFGAAAQDLEASWGFAQELLSQGQYESAALTFERILLFDKERQFPEAIVRVADCHKRAGNYVAAAGFYQRAYFAVQTDSLQNEMILQKSFCLLQGKEFQEAIAELFHLPDEGSKEYLNRKDFYLGIAHFGAERFLDAEGYFESWLKRSTQGSEGKEGALRSLSDLFDENDRISRLNPRKARMMSLIIPGSGQIYAGDWRNGLNSLAITGGLYYLFYINAQQTTFWESLLIVFPWFQRYYSGGMDAAYRITKTRKAERRAEKYREIIQLLRSSLN